MMDQYIIFNETPKFYRKYIKSIIPKNNYDRWSKKNLNDLLLDDKDFILIKDRKWKDDNTNNLHLLAICADPKLHSIRDLTGADINLLNNIKQKTLRYINQNYNLSPNEFDIYLHYYPHIWQLHIHFVNLNKDDIKPTELRIGKTHYLDDIINNLKINKDYYQKSNLTICCRKNKISNMIYKKKI